MRADRPCGPKGEHRQGEATAGFRPGKDGRPVQGILEETLSLQIPPEERFSLTQQVAWCVAQKVFQVQEPEPGVAEGHPLPRPQLRTAAGQKISKPADALRKGALMAHSVQVCLLVVGGEPVWPEPLRRALEGMGRASAARLVLADPWRWPERTFTTWAWPASPDGGGWAWTAISPRRWPWASMRG